MPRHAGIEQRRSVRTAVEVDLLLARKAGRPVVTRTLDLGAGGARVTSDRPLRVDEQLHFDVDLPGAGRHLDGTARVLRQDRHNVYALRFEDVPADALAELRAFVETSAGAAMH